MRIRIEGVAPYDGEWDAGKTMDEWTNAEWAILKRISGELPLTVADKIEGADVTVITAIAIVALRRSKRFPRIDEELLWEAPVVSYKLILGDDEEAKDDPLPEREPVTPGTPSGSHSPNGSTPDPERSLDSTGLPSSDMPASDPETSTT